MSSEIRANLISSRAGLSTVTMTDSGPMFSGITTFVDNSGFTFGVGGGTSIFTPATNVLTFGTNNTEKIRIDASGHMHGVGVITATHFYGDGSNLTGISAGFSPDAQGNLVAGTNAGSSLDGSSAEYNILLGENAGESIDGDDNNIAIGYDAGKNNTASSNIFMGRDAAKALNSSLNSQNIFIGHEAVSNKANISGTVVGAQAGIGNGTGINLTLFGYRAGGNSYNSTTFIGHQAGRSATSACDFTTAVGSNSLYNNAGRGNVAIGNLSGQVLTSGKFNTLAGYMAGRGGLSGTINYTDCVAIGSSVAVDLSSANNVIVIGANANPSSNTVTNEITLGNANITKFRIPGIDFILKDNGGTPTQGHVLTVDGSGEAGFAAPAGPTINNNANTRVITASGNANEFDAQASLTFSTSSNDPKLTISGTGHAQLNLTSTGGTDHTGINFGDSADINAGMIQYSNTGNAMQFHTDGSEKLRITSGGHVNIGGQSTQTTHLLHLQSTGDAGIHIRADTDNSGENDNPYLSMSQDGSAAQLFKIGMVGDAGNEFAQSIANAPFIHANTANTQPLQFAHQDNLAVTISAIESSHFHSTGGNSTGGVKIANRGNDTAAALLFQVHNNTGTPGQATNTQLTHLGANLEFEIKHNGTRAIHIGSTRRIRLPGIVGVAGSGLQTVYVESDGNLCTTSSLRQYKTNITAISDTSWLYELNPVTFNWKKKTEVDGENVWEDTADSNGTQYGLIAEEVETVKKDFCSYDNNDKLTGVHYDRMIAPLIKAVQDLKSEINILQQENIALRTRLTNLEDK